MSMKELGDLFKTARQDAGLSLQEVHERTRISLYVLESLENGEAARLPHPVYAKGFIRNYAEILGLDQNKVVQEYLGTIGGIEDSLEIDPGVPELNVRRKTRAKTGTVWLIVMGTAVLAAAVWLIVSYVSREIRPVPPVVMEQNASSDTGLEGSAADPEEEMEPSEESAGMDRESSDNQGKPVDDQEASSLSGPGISGPEEDHGSVKTEAGQPVSGSADIGSATSEDVVPEDSLTRAPQAESASDSSGADSSSEDTETDVVDLSTGTSEPDVTEPSTDTSEVVTKAHLLRIEATHDCWLRAIADQKTSLYKTVRILEPGQSVNVPFDEDVELRLGNAGGVRLFVDDRPYPFEGGLGDVATVVVSAPAE